MRDQRLEHMARATGGICPIAPPPRAEPPRLAQRPVILASTPLVERYGITPGAAEAALKEAEAVLDRAAGLLNRAQKELAAFDKADADARALAVANLKAAIKAGTEYRIAVDDGRRFASRRRLEERIAILRQAKAEFSAERDAASRRRDVALYENESPQRRMERLQLANLRK